MVGRTTLKESTITPEAEQFMAQALTLARRGLGRTDPNPMVGAVIVKNGIVVGRGYHRAVGEPHAEVEAIRDAGSQVRGAELFVTLEPCNHFGRTPPCTAAIIEAKIKRVWYGTADPNPGVRGGGAESLRKAGVEVVGPVKEEQCRRLNEVYLTHVTLQRPFVFLKLAMSLDGKIATRTGQSKWITSEASRKEVHKLRDRVSAVMVGLGTVLADDPALTTRIPGKKGRDPIRIIVDSALRTPAGAAVFNPDSSAGAIIGCRRNPPRGRRTKLEKGGAEIIPTNGDTRVDLGDLLQRLYQRGITSVLIEGGARLAWSALNAKVVDRCFFFYSPMIIGGMEAPTGVGGEGIDALDYAPRLVDVEMIRTGPDILVTGRVYYPGPTEG